MELFRELGIKIKGLEGSIGSGCIFQTKEKKYVLTAQHCITEDITKRTLTEEEITELNIINSRGNSVEIVSVYIPQQESDDFAVIEIIDLLDYPNVLIDSPKINMKYKFFGFPNYLADDNNQGDSLDGYISDIVGDKLILQNELGTLSDADNDAKDNMVGYSGSGIYTLQNENFYLIGILTSLRASGEHGKTQGININKINEFLQVSDLPKLIPSKLDDFNLYFANILSQEGESNSAILSKVYKDNLDGISPYYLSDLLNERITIPYNKNLNLLNEEIWEGWVQLLLYISLYKNEKITKENLEEHINLSKHSKSKNMLFYTEDTRIQKFVKNLYDSAHKDVLLDEAIVFVNSKNIRINDPVDPKRFNSIVHNISETETFFFDKGIDIANPNEKKNIIIVPIRYIMVELEKVLMQCEDDRKNIYEIEKICIGKMKNMFEHFLKLLLMEEECVVERV